jgi:plastocyanin
MLLLPHNHHLLFTPNFSTMKKLFATLLLALPLLAAQATIHTVQVSNNQYTPATLSAGAGDTIRFQWASGNHPTSSDNGAWTTFPMNSNATSHDVVLLLPGSYPYHCDFHGAAGGIGMAGTITVTALAAPKNVQDALNLNVSPNPATEQIVVDHNYPQVDLIRVTNAIGAEKRSVRAVSGMPLTLNIADLPAGVYFVSLQNKGQRIATKRLVKER